MPGLHEARAGDTGRIVSVTRAGVNDVRAAWRAVRSPEPLLVRHFPSGEPFLVVEADTEVGYRIWAHELGEHVLTPDGSSVRSFLPDRTDWQPNRLVCAQVLPLLAVLNGIEVLHAAAVRIADATVILVALSGVGKSSTAAHLMARGASFVADDGVGLEMVGDALVVHPGPRVLNLSQEQVAALDGPAMSRLGRPIAASDSGGRPEVHIQPAETAAPAPAAAVIFLDRVDAPVGELNAVPEPATRLLGSSHVAFLATPQRQVRQLDVVAHLAATAAVLRCTIGRREDAGTVASRIAGWAEAR
jgi:hypothetical protein